MQSWKIALRRKRRLIKIIIFTVIALMIGTLPYVDNFAHIGAIVFGLPLSIVFVPYITFGFVFIDPNILLCFMLSYQVLFRRDNDGK